MGSRGCQDRCNNIKAKIHPQKAYLENCYCKMCSCFFWNKDLVTKSGLRCPCCNNKVRMSKINKKRRPVKRIGDKPIYKLEHN